MSSQRATISVPTYHLAEEMINGKKKKYVVYHIVITHTGFERKVFRRYTNFEEFHRAWGTLYPVLAEKHPLPNNAILIVDNPKYILMNRAGKAEARRPKLEAYLRDTLAIDAILDFFLPFLECEKTDLKKKIAAADEDLKPKPSTKVAEEDRKTSTGLKIITTAPVDATAAANKGNDFRASAKANRQRARFEKKLDELGVSDPTQAVSFSMTHANATGKVLSPPTSPRLEPENGGAPIPPPRNHKASTATASSSAAAAASTSSSSSGARKPIYGRQTVVADSASAHSAAAASPSAVVLVTAVAMFDFAPPPDKMDCIALKKDEQIVVVEQSSDEWWFGRRGDGKDGFFPANYVRIIKTTALPKGPPPPRPSIAVTTKFATAPSSAAARADAVVSPVTAPLAGAGSNNSFLTANRSVAPNAGNNLRAPARLTSEQIKNMKRSSYNGPVSSQEKPVSLLSPAQLAAARASGVRSDDDDDDEQRSKPIPPPPPRTALTAAVPLPPSRPGTGSPSVAISNKPKPPPPRSATINSVSLASSPPSTSPVPPPPPKRPSAIFGAAAASAASPTLTTTAAPRPPPPLTRAAPPPMAAALKASIASTPALKPTGFGVTTSRPVSVTVSGRAPPPRPPSAGASPSVQSAAAAPAKAFCTGCGTKVGAGLKAFCVQCGAKL